MAIDIAIQQDAITGKFYTSLSNGDFLTNNSFDTSLTISLFGDRRADPSEVPIVQNRRGWWGNAFNTDDIEFELGSKLWLLYQERATPATLNKAVSYAREALQWLVDDQHAQRINVSGVLSQNNIQLNIKIFRDSGVTETRYYDLWDNTGTV